MLHRQVSGVGNQESEQVAPHAVFRSSNKATKTLAKLDNLGMGRLGPFFVSLKEHSACRHRVWIKSFDLNYEEFLGSLNKVFPHGVARRLERGTKLELSVIDEAQRAWPGTGSAHSLHKLDSDLVVVEDQTVVDLGLWNGAYTKHSLSDNTKVALTSHNDVIHVRAI